MKFRHAISLSRGEFRKEGNMNIRNTGVPGAVLGLLLVSAQASADCGAARSAFKEGELMCLKHHAFRCGPMGTWTHLPQQCGADNVIRRQPMPTQPPGPVKPDATPAAPQGAPGTGHRP
jgi:hypothetical protein